MRTPKISESFFSSRRRHTTLQGDWSSDVCSSDLCRLVGFTGRDEDMGTGGNRGEECEQGEKRRGGTPVQGHAASRRRRGPEGPQPRLAAGGGTGGVDFGAPASRGNASG